MSLRAATAADVDAIRELTREAYSKWVPLIGREPLPMIADYAEAVRKHRIDPLDIDGRLAALIEMVPAADHLLIENIAVAPARQGQGIGKSCLPMPKRWPHRLGWRISCSSRTSGLSKMCCSI